MVSTQSFGDLQRSRDFEVVLQWEGADCVLNVSGELDMSTYDAFDGFLVAALNVHGSVIVDMAAVTFVDTMGLTPLLRRMDQADDRGERMQVRNVPSSVLRMMEMLPSLAETLRQ